MICRRHATLYAVFIVILLGSFSLFAQVPAGINTEQKPTPRDPRYLPPSLPGHMQPEVSPALLFAPGGDVDLEKASKHLQKQERQKQAREESGRARSYYQQENDRTVYEKKVLRQFGLEKFKYADPNESYSETPGRRFQIVYFLSLPFAAALAGGLYSLSLQSRGDVRSLTFYETAGALAAGAVASGGIAYYDYRRTYGGGLESRMHLPHTRPGGPGQKRIPPLFLGYSLAFDF